MSDGSARLVTSLLVVGLALTLAACGDSDDGGANGDANASQEQSDRGTDSSEADKKEITALMKRLRERYNESDGEAFCANLTSAGQQEVRDLSARMPEFPNNCVGMIKGYSALFVKSGGAQRPVRVRKVTVDGDKGAVTMKGGLAGIRSIATYRVASDDGKWKLDNPISGAETRRLGE